MVDATTKMKALVVARLMMGDFENWATFNNDLKMAEKITNRRTARSVSSQIGRRYQDLSDATNQFMRENFEGCGFQSLSDLCEIVSLNNGLSVRLDEFEKTHFALAPSVKARFPIYTHIHISTYGLQF